jgi:flagellar L-ring protein precursor FlgH
MSLTVRTFVAALLLCASFAGAQQRQSPQDEQNPPVRTTASLEAGAEPPLVASNNQDAVNAGLLMQQNGGSLLKATLAAPPDPQQAPLSSVSFFAVAPPEPRVVRKHDLVTIIVRQESEFSSEGKTETKKEASLDAALSQFIKLHIDGGNLRLSGDALSAPLAIKADGSREFTGEGNVEAKDSFVTRIQARVVDVKPNDTIVLEARSEIAHDDESQRLILSGTARAEDISPDNSILSTQLYDLSLKKQTKGNVRNATKKGFFPKLLDVINPF